MADGTTFPPFQTIPDLPPADALNFTDQVWINQAGVDARANLQDIANLTLPLTVTAFNGRTGPVQLTLLDITSVGGAPSTSPFFDGVPQAVTPPLGASDNRIATTEFVQDALSGSVAGVASFNGRVGAVTLTGADIAGAGGATAAQLANYLPLTGGVLAGPGNLTVNGFTALGGIESSDAVLSGDLSIGAPKSAHYVWAGPATGAAAAPAWRPLTAADITGLPTGTVTSVGLSAPADMTVTGSPVTGAGTLNITRAIQLQNLVLASPNGAAGIPSYRALTQSDISGGVGVTSVGLAMPAPFTVVGANPITGAGILTVSTSSQPQNTVWAAPLSGGPGAPAFRQLTQADIQGGVGVTSLGLTMPADFTVANSPVTGAGAIAVTRASQAAGLVLASPAGAAGVPAYRALVGTDLPNPSTTTKGGVQAVAAAAHQWVNSISAAGVPGVSQPSAADLSDTVARTTFLPTVSFATPGDLAVVYQIQNGAYVKVGPMVTFWITVRFSPTYTTAAGGLVISFPPVAPTDTSNWNFAPRRISGTPTQVWPGSPTADGYVTIATGPTGFAPQSFQSGGAAPNSWTTAQYPSGGNYYIYFGGTYF